jgi:uncharacterized secreted protein with C-terminal beta-propeller domain
MTHTHTREVRHGNRVVRGSSLFAHGRRAMRIPTCVTLLLAGSIQCTPHVSPADTLYSFDTCEDLQVFLEDRVLHPRVASAHGLFSGGFLLGCGGGDLAEVSAGGDGDGDAAPETREFTETNTQEEEVDEADFVKNDGDHIYVLRRGHMLVVDAWPASEAEILSDTLVGGFAFTMFKDGERAMVVSSERPLLEGSLTGENAGTLTLSLFDLYDKRAPLLIRRIVVEGDYVDARRVGDEVMLVSRSRLSWPTLNRNGPFRDDENREKLRESPVLDAFPTLTDERIGIDPTPRARAAVECGNTYATDDTNAEDILLVHGISMRDPDAPVKSTSVVTSWSHLYASEHAIYLASAKEHDGGYFTPPYTETRIHKLRAFQGTGAAVYVASGAFEGVIKDQFSLSERDDRLRVVTTINTSATGFAEANVTSLLVFEESSVGDMPTLVEVGRADDIGQDEFVQAVRFIGDFAYIVTYPEETFWEEFPPSPQGEIYDPLFVVDLTDATNPRLRGHLEVEGYSTYIHPLDDDHVLTVGVNTTTENIFQGLTLQIFDVSDRDQPRQRHIRYLGDETSRSDALTNHHAFTFFQSRGLLGIPHQKEVDGVLTSSALEVFRVDAESGFTDVGVLEQLPMVGEGASACAAVKRSVMIAEGDEAYVYAVSTAGMTIARIDDVLTPVTDVVYGDGTCADAGFPM